MAWWQVASLVTAFVLLGDRVMTRLEARGLVYWRRHRAPSGAASAAMLQLQSLLEPSSEYVVEERARASSEVDDAADDEPLAPHLPTSTP